MLIDPLITEPKEPASPAAVSANRQVGRPKSVHMQSGPKPKRWELTKLQAIHHEILRLKLTGMKNTQVAEVLGVTSATVNYTVNSSLGRQKLQLMQAAKDVDAIDWQRRVQSLVPGAFDALEDGLDPSTDLKLRVQVASMVTKDLAGLAAPKQINATHLHAHLSAEEIEEVKRRGLEQAVAAGMVIDTPSDDPDVVDI